MVRVRNTVWVGADLPLPSQTMPSGVTLALDDEVRFLPFLQILRLCLDGLPVPIKVTV